MPKERKINRRFHVKLTNGEEYSEEVSSSRLLSWELAWKNWSQLKDEKILEIGPRYSRWALRKQLQLNNCEYYSITAGKSELRRKNVVHPPEGKITSPGNFFTATDRLTDHFEEGFFDRIIGIESFEHWGHQIGKRIEGYPRDGEEAYKVGIEQCSKVLKKGGWFEQEVPIQSHGEGYFVYELWEDLEKNFPKDTWSKMEIIEKGRPEGYTSVEACKHTERITPDAAPPYSTLRCSDCCWNAMLRWQRV